MIDFRAVASSVALIVAMIGVLMLVPALADLLAGRQHWSVFGLSGLGTVLAAAALFLATHEPGRRPFGRREAFLFTTTSWVTASAFAAIPFTLGETAMPYPAAFFEAVSGLTATGGTAITGLDARPHGILLWRSILTVVGGAGIVILGVAILPALQVGGMQTLRAETGEREQLFPRAALIAKWYLGTYAILIVACGLAYRIAGMDAFDALNHAFTTVATGGFSTRDASIGHFASPAIDMVCIVFMLAGALPFMALIQALRGRPGELWRHQEIRLFLVIVAVLTAALFAAQAIEGRDTDLTGLRHALFNVVTLITTAGFATVDYTDWGPSVTAILFVVALLGGCAGSTAGGFKVFRLIVIAQVVRLAVTRLRMPHAIVPIRFDGRPVSERVLVSVLGFLVLYVVTIFVVALALNIAGLDLITALSGAAANVSNVGPGLGPRIGPAGNYAGLSATVYWILAAAMLLGRLEFFTILVLLMPRFWKG